jgi:hypothetical protein
LDKIPAARKPEAAYFTEQNGKRGAVMIVNLPDDAPLPALAEPWLLTFEGGVGIRIAMAPEDLQPSGIDGRGRTWGETGNVGVLFRDQSASTFRLAQAQSSCRPMDCKGPFGFYSRAGSARRVFYAKKCFRDLPLLAGVGKFPRS